MTLRNKELLSNMSTTCDYVTYDVFTQTRYSGNPLAVVHLPAEGDQLTQAQKQEIATEFNYSETVFLHPKTLKGSTEVDIFTRFKEIPFAGHPVIGTAHYLRQYIADRDNKVVDKLRMIIKAGVVDVEFDDTGLAIAEVPLNLRTHKESVSIERILSQHPELASLKSNLPHQCPVISSVKGMA
jgi:PhzF family phenazine biosynthesis protein